MREIELEYIIQRLESFDIKDIHHFNATLNTRLIPYKYADRLIGVYNRQAIKSSEYEIPFLQLIILHFSDKVYLNEELWKDFM